MGEFQTETFSRWKISARALSSALALPTRWTLPSAAREIASAVAPFSIFFAELLEQALSGGSLVRFLEHWECLRESERERLITTRLGEGQSQTSETCVENRWETWIFCARLCRTLFRS